MKKTSYISLLFVLAVTLLTAIVGCKSEKPSVEEQEDKEAKKLLQGVWINADDESLTMKVKGDTIYYADSTSVPAYFAIISDTLVIRGSTEQHLPIVKQTEHLFQFKNSAGDLISLQKSDDESMAADIPTQQAICTLNQNEIIKRDTIMNGAGQSYHIYTQVNPTKYRVLHSVLNSDGVAVDNAYYDNIVHVGVFVGAQKIFGANFYKQDLAKYLPDEYQKQGILSDIVPAEVNEDGIHLDAYMCIPDNPVVFTVNILISKDGKMSMSVDN